MTAAKQSKATTKPVKSGKSDASFTELLKARAPAEDIAAYEPDAFSAAARLASAALASHRSGQSVINIENPDDIDYRGRPLTVVTVINDNMPFLFDSVVGEITDSAGEPTLVLHPVLLVRHGRNGVTEIVGDGAGVRASTGVDRVSLIHVHVARMSRKACAALAARIEHILSQVKAAVADWKPMLARLDQAITDFRYQPLSLDKAAVTEAVAFLEWLRDDNFTFLGMREYRYSGGERNGLLERTNKPGLGILKNPDVLVLRRGTEAVTTTPEIRAFLHGPEPLIVTKANAKSVVHRRIYLDYVGVKTFDLKGKLTGELRIVGLFTSTAYTRSVMKIPYLRSKADAVVAKSGFDPGDHSGKALINVLESYPRDELFQISAPVLRKHAEAILALGERPRVRALYRVDQFDRFVSVLVYVPRDRYDSRVRIRIGEFLVRTFDGRLSAYYPAFPEGGLARVHFIIGRSGGKTPKVDSEMLEEGIRQIVRTWDDALREAASGAGVDDTIAEIASRMPENYRNSFTPDDALVDAACVAEISPDSPIAINFYLDEPDRPSHSGLKIFHHGAPVELSKRVPLLENIGFRVISERTFEYAGNDGGRVFIHDMELESAQGRPIDLSDGGALFEEVFLAVWNGRHDNDAYNALAQTAGLRVDQIGILRAYGRYLQQAGIPQSQEFIAAALNRYPAIARNLHALFVSRFDPSLRHDAEAAGRNLAIEEAILEELEGVPSIDDDTIVRRYLNLIQSTLRTNHFAPPDGADRRVSLAIKFDSRNVTGLPEPRPWREIFVYGPEVEGVHLRFGPVARGGLRWSDRAQDYRTEVLGLVKAQQVKNAVIVPVGAKGGFYPRHLPAGGTRDAVFEAGRQAYVNFVSSMLSITDNLDIEKVVPPHEVVRHDADDPYFVVAADKGTATFSDTANAISQDHGFWLDDAFASGGSAGYDHKKMGITARGAWEAVKRHFREMNRDIQAQPFSAVGVGDMSGDVFGNGMLLSRQTRLIAAFDHRDIFIDPDPDPAISFAERTRMFALPRSSWQDYDKSKLSKGGAVISRSQKSIQLSAEAAAAIGLAKTVASPTEIMSAILRADVDLLWFGGIGTYVRATGETNQDVGDRANDPIRLTASQIGAKVVGEGANLGMTQRARIEFCLRGGRCNSDAIDNSGGVNSSDVEVNIKIALAAAMRKNTLTRPARNKLLADMTEEVASLVLANNYQQTLALSLVGRRGAAETTHLARLMTALETRGLLDRAVEDLPGPAALEEREARGDTLTRPEIGVLLAYAKIVLFDDIVASALPDDPHLENDLLGYFPGRMARKFGDDIRAHRLRREIIATVLGNDAINRGGPAFVNRLQDLTGATAYEVVAAFAAVRDGFDLDTLYAEIDALDNKVDGAFQLSLYQSVVRLTEAATAWHLKNGPAGTGIGERARNLKDARKTLEPRLAVMMPRFLGDSIAERRQMLLAGGVPESTADRIAGLTVAELVPDMDLVARRAGAELMVAGKAFFAVSEAFRIARIEDAARAITPSDYYDGLALSRATDMIGAARRGIAISALQDHGKADDPVAAWLEAGGDRVVRTRERLQSLTEGGELSVSKLTVAAGLIGDLAVNGG